MSGLDFLPDGALVYVRFRSNDEDGRLVPIEVYLESVTGDRLRGEHLRRLPLDLIETFANADGGRLIRSRLNHASVPLGILASYYSTEWGNPHGQLHRPHWVADAFWSQFEEFADEVPPAPRNRGPRGSDPADGRPAALLTPPDGRYTAEWFGSLAAAYSYAVMNWQAGKGSAPAIELARQAGVSPNTVRSWIYRARRAGFMDKGRQGAAG